MANITFLPDSNGEKQAFNYMVQLNELAKTDLKLTYMLAFIMAGLEHLEACRIFPVGADDPYTVILNVDLPNGSGMCRELVLVKPLAISPVLELRVDWHGIGCFRSTFFPFRYQGEEHYCFVKAFIKTNSPKFDPTNQMRDETFQIYKQVEAMPQQFLKNHSKG